MSENNNIYRVVMQTESMREMLDQIEKTISATVNVAFLQSSQMQSTMQQLSQQLSEMNRRNWTISIPHIYASIDSINTEVLRSALEAGKELHAVTEATALIGENFRQKMIDVTRNLDFISQRAVADLVATNLAFQEIAVSGVLRDFIELVTEEGDAAEAFKEAGWPIAPSMPRSLRARVAKMHNEGRTRYVSRSIMGYYQRDGGSNLLTMVAGWADHPLFASRMHIIRDAVDAHMDGKYTLSVPALLPQVEGILNDFVRENNLSAEPGRIKEVYETIIGDLDGHTLASWAIANTLLYQLQTSTYAYTPFKEQLERSIHQRKTTRHTVLHGIAIGYDRPIHSLKVLLILDSITALQSPE